MNPETLNPNLPTPPPWLAKLPPISKLQRKIRYTFFLGILVMLSNLITPSFLGIVGVVWVCGSLALIHTRNVLTILRMRKLVEGDDATWCRNNHRVLLIDKIIFSLIPGCGFVFLLSATGVIPEDPSVIFAAVPTAMLGANLGLISFGIPPNGLSEAEKSTGPGYKGWPILLKDRVDSGA